MVLIVTSRFLVLHFTGQLNRGNSFSNAIYGDATAMNTRPDPQKVCKRCAGDQVAGLIERAASMSAEESVILLLSASIAKI